MLHQLQELLHHAKSKGWEANHCGNMATTAAEIQLSMYIGPSVMSAAVEAILPPSASSRPFDLTR